ncbi:MAG: hypothetical protein Q9192_002062 [Flavoplaca navasiana]
MSSNPTRSAKLGASESYMNLTGKIIKVLVGPSEYCFSIHRGLLTSKSTFFNAALTGSWREAEEDTVRLVEEVPELFAIYVVWIYGHDWTVDHNRREHSLAICCRLYVLADVLGSEELGNLMIDQIRDIVARPHLDLTCETIGYVYDNTLPESPLRRLIVDILTWELKPDKNLVTEVPECLYDIVWVFINRQNKKISDKKPYADKIACKNYHVHRDGTPCPLLIKPDADQSKSIPSKGAVK